MLLVRVLTSAVTVKGDGSSTTLRLSLLEFPFVENPPGKVVEVGFGNHPYDGDSITFDSKTCTVEFEHEFSGTVQLAFNVTYDPS